MRRAQWRKVAQYVKNSRYRSVWRKAVRVMACIVVFCTTYALILPAITVEKNYFCGMEAHAHTEECVSQTTLQQLICQLPERAAHTHGEGCWEEDSLVCTMEEFTPHAHGETCLDETGALICTLEEAAEHLHSEGCYEEAVQETLICEIPEHIHHAACQSDPNADLETAEIWEATLDHVTLTGNWAKDLTAIAATQVGYRESEWNYLAEEGQPQKGYTRYGAWYGIPYGEWDAMFVSFCLHYAGIPQEAIPGGSDSSRWLAALEAEPLVANAMNKVPGAGDLLFYTDKEQEDAQTRVAVVLALEAQESESDEEISRISLRLIEGGLQDQVLQRQVTMEEITILGCCGTDLIQQAWEAQAAAETTAATAPTETTAATVPQETTVETQPTETTPETEPVQWISQMAETENYTVTVTYSSDLILPEGTELRVVEYPRDSDVFHQRCEEAGYELDWLLNIGFFLEDQELNLDGDFQVMVTSKQGEELGQDITHFAEDGAERITGADASESVESGQTAVAFSAEGFSDFGGGVAPAAETGVSSGIATFAIGSVMEADSFAFTTANPASLDEDTDYVLYFASGQNYRFLGSDLSNISVNNTGYYTSPITIGYQWGLSADQMGTTFAADFAWRVVKSGNEYYLESQKDGRRLQINWNGLALTDNGTLLTNAVDGNGTKIRNSSNYYLRYNNGFTGTYGSSAATTVYLAEVEPAYRNYPDAVYTGDVHVDRLRFYNICEGQTNGVTALAGCVFKVEGTTSTGEYYTTEIISGNEPQIALPEKIPDGKYTITEVSVPEGYMRDLNYVREFWIEDGALQSDHNIGTFLNHSLERLTVGKTGEVEDYNNRIYEILMNAKTNLRMYEMDPIDVLFLVDKSNSMLFPSGMVATGKSITLRADGENNVRNNQSVLDTLNKDEMHYIIADPAGTATVYAIWHDGTAWLYQDASYYAKAMQNNGEGYQSNGEIVIFPGDRTYNNQSTWEDETYGTEYRSNGGGLNHSFSGSTLGTYITDNGGSVTFQLYTAKDQYNRLHYLEEALANMIYELADANHKNRVTLIPFTKEVQETIYYPLDSNNAITQPVELTTTNAEMLVDIVTHIDTTGGTRQDLALEHAHEEYLAKTDEFDKAHTYTILITDGAPVRSGSSAPPLGNPDSEATTADNGEIYGRIKGWGAKVREESTLMTVALGMEQVEGGKKVLKQIASTDEFYCALDDASALTESMQRILFDGMKDKGELAIDGYIEDEISDSFYPIAWIEPSMADLTGRTKLTESNNRAWLLLQNGDWITLDGKYTTEGASDAAGQLLQKEDGTYYIRWQNQPVSGAGWTGTFYVKAKEDFIGGNAIDTNKSAHVTVNDATKTMDTPTVNVHLLKLNENSSEVTVYLGDTINDENSSPRDVLKAFYEDIQFTKLISNGGDVLNKFNAADADGLEDATFYLKYALGYEKEDGKWVSRDLTDDEWATLESGGSLTIPYVYDDASSHGNVGYFTIRLNKTSDTYLKHTAATACQPQGDPLTEDCENPAETYTLTVTYTAYELGESGRPESNVNNGTGSPGTEVTKTATGLNNGQGIITSENVHEVHVIFGKIVIRKVFGEGVTWTAGDTFTFQLTRAEDGATISETVTIGADGTATATFDLLSRGTYTVTEAMDDDYAVKTVTVGEGTNAYYSQPDPMQVTFVMGNNLSNENVIGKAKEDDLFTSYIDPVNGVYGEAQFTNAPRIYTGEIPVEKIWDDGNDQHKYHEVYVVLYLNDQPMLDTDGNARLLRIDASTNWEGVFTVVLGDKNDSVDNYHYSVREISSISEEKLNGWTPAILENDGTTLLYYQQALEQNSILGVGGRGYIVQYAKDENGTLTVTNLKGFDLPETGGMGTHMYTFSGLAMILAALMYGYSLRRKRERGARS